MPQDTHTKILATIGPSSATREQIEKLIDAGADAWKKKKPPSLPISAISLQKPNLPVLTLKL